MSSRDIICIAKVLVRMVFMRCLALPMYMCSYLAGVLYVRVFSFPISIFFIVVSLCVIWAVSWYSCVVVDFSLLRRCIRFTIGSVAHCISPPYVQERRCALFPTNWASCVSYLVFGVFRFFCPSVLLFSCIFVYLALVLGILFPGPSAWRYICLPRFFFYFCFLR